MSVTCSFILLYVLDRYLLYNCVFRSSSSNFRNSLHISSCTQISVLGNGLLPISPEAIVVGDIKDVDLSEYLPLDEKQEELTKALGSTNKA